MFIKIAINTLFIIFMALLTITNSYAALSAKTIKKIEGSAPYIKLNGSAINELADLLSFQKPDSSSGYVEIYPSIDKVIYAHNGDKFNQFITKVVADGQPNHLSNIVGVSYADDDGDLAHLTMGITGTLTATWSYRQPDGTIRTLSADELKNKLDSCQGPYQLTISANNVKVQSQYGIPSERAYGSLSKTYTIKVDDFKICYIKPASLQIYDASGVGVNTCTNTTNCKFIGGYNPSVFIPNEGFSALAPTKFPTTAFDKAKFTLIMSGEQSDYIYTSSNPNLVSISNVAGSEGVVTFNSSVHPNLPFDVTLSARTKPNIITPSKTSIYSFTINKWIRALPPTQYKTERELAGNGIFPAANACAGRDLGMISAEEAASYFYSPMELSNAPNAATAVTGHGTGSLPSWIHNKNTRLSRDIDGTFYGEWGNLYSYPQSGFNLARGCTWSSQTATNTWIFGVNVQSGYVGYNALQNNGCIPVCRK
ncbi:hypothetical protein [Gilliamella intestini]|uniref:hypothetical protein n=1 Tax=Gilliamella intestini TaxID=1798183 RepID=UPI000B8A48F3|nr:hypothetical protein [Gilliamella intestini]